MKKIILSLVVVFAAIAANAQDIFVGGSFGWTHNDATDHNAFNISPEVGYNFNENWAVAGIIAYTHDKVGSVKFNGFAIEPYARYTFFRKNIVRLFVDGALGFSTNKQKDGDSENGFEIGFKPGIAIDVTDHLSLEAKYGFLGYRDQFSLAGANASVSGLDLDPNSLTFSVKYAF